MDITIFLAKVIGWYLVISSIYVFVHRQNIRLFINSMAAETSLMLVLNLFTLILGLLIVISHNTWVLAWPVIITVIGWLIVLSALFRLFFPDFMIRTARWWGNHVPYILVITVIYLLVGLYLLAKAYLLI